MNFGQALEALKQGQKVARSGWNGKGMWLLLVAGTPMTNLRAGAPYAEALGQPAVDIDPHIDMFTAKGTMQPGWLASQADMLAEDWGVV